MNTFDPNNPAHRAAYICASAGFLGGGWHNLTWENRVALGHAIEEMFPGVEYEDLIAKVQGIDYRPKRKDLLAKLEVTETFEEMDARKKKLRARAMAKVGLA